MRAHEPKSSLGTFYIEDAASSSFPGYLEFGDDPKLYILTKLDGIADLVLSGDTSQYQSKVDIASNHTTHGIFSLFDCMSVSTQSNHDFANKTTTRELTFKPTSIWLGGRPLRKDDKFSYMKMEFDSLHGIIGTKNLIHKFVEADSQRDDIRHVLGDVDEIYYTDRGAKPHKIEVGGYGVIVAFHSGVSASMSWTEGDSISTYDVCSIHCDTAKTLEDLLGIAYKIEQFLSFICLHNVHCTALSVENAGEQLNDFEKFDRLWVLGNHTTAEDVMFHQALSSFFQEPDTIGQALARWFVPSDDDNIARWLFIQNVNDASISIGRFISICQIVEIIGRSNIEYVPFDRRKFKEAATRAADIICRTLGPMFETPDFRKRFEGLVKSGNRRSFRDLAGHFCDGIPQMIVNHYLPDRDEFIVRVVKMRNILTHMEDLQSVMNDSQVYLGEMIYRLLTLVAAHQAVRLGLEPARILSGLTNSGVGRAADHFIARFGRREPRPRSL